MKTSARQASGPVMAANLLLLALLICILDFSGGNLAEARYLPTRSGQSSEIETLKEIIKNLMHESPAGVLTNNSRQQRLSSLLHQRETPLPMTKAASAGYLQRRAPEMSLSSANGDESNEYRMPPYDNFNTGSQLYGQMESQSGPDR